MIRVSSQYFFLFLLYVTSVFISDVLMLLLRLLGIYNFSTNIFVLDFILFGFSYFIFFKRATFEFRYQLKVVYPILLLIFAMTIWKLPLPDNSTDTLYYHLFSQSKYFNDNINYNFFPAYFGTFLYPLADRLFLGFRELLGFRAGTILNSIVYFVLWTQVYSILIKQFPKLYMNPRGQRLLYWGSFCIVFCEHVVVFLSTYLVDILFLPFLLESLYLAIRKDKSFEGEKSDFVLTVFLSSLATAMKLTNIVLALPYCIYQLYHLRKGRPSLHILFFLILALTPILFYGGYNYSQVGDPAFPMLNRIFKSNYYPHFFIKEQTDYLMGPASISDYLVYPFKILSNPFKTVNLGNYTGHITLGYVVVLSGLIMLINLQFREIIRRHSKLFIVYIFSLFIWIISTGYLRYGLMIEIMSTLVVVVIAIELFREKVLYRAISCFIGLVLLLQTFWSVHILYHKNLDWAWRPSLIQDFNNYWSNAKMILRDHYSNIEADRKIDGWFIFFFNVGHAISIKNNVPITNIDFKSPYLPGWDEMPAIKSGIKMAIDKSVNREIYTVVKYEQFGKLLLKLRPLGFGIKDITLLRSHIISRGDRLVLVHLDLMQSLDERYGQNIIRDYSFEDRDRAWESKNLEQHIIETQSSFGKLVARARINESLIQLVRVKPSQVYKFSLQAKGCEVPSDAQLQINWHSKSGFVSASIDVFRTENSWKNQETYFFSPDNAESAVVYIAAREDSWVCFDNIELKEVSYK